MRAVLSWFSNFFHCSANCHHCLLSSIYLILPLPWFFNIGYESLIWILNMGIPRRRKKKPSDQMRVMTLWHKLCPLILALHVWFASYRCLYSFCRHRNCLDGFEPLSLSVYPFLFFSSLPPALPNPPHRIVAMWEIEEESIELDK